MTAKKVLIFGLGSIGTRHLGVLQDIGRFEIARDLYSLRAKAQRDKAVSAGKRSSDQAPLSF